MISVINSIGMKMGRIKRSGRLNDDGDEYDATEPTPLLVPACGVPSFHAVYYLIVYIHANGNVEHSSDIQTRVTNDTQRLAKTLTHRETWCVSEAIILTTA